MTNRHNNDLEAHQQGRTSPGEIETGTAGRACEACHKKKTKCDMQQPICGLCRRTNKVCHFPSTRKRPSRQEPSVRAKLQKVNGNLDRLVELLEANPGAERDTLKSILNINDTNWNEHHDDTGAGVSGGHEGSSYHSDMNFTNSPTTATEGRASYRPVFIQREVAKHLIEIYFEYISPWLSIFHKPSFLGWSEDLLMDGEDSLAAMSVSAKVMFNGMFALAARFSNHPFLAKLQPRERGEKFMRSTEYWFRIVRDSEEFDLTFLKGCVLLSHYHYACGNAKRGWYISHMCIRGCYELGLHQIDEAGDMDDPNAPDWEVKESLRRTFWAIYEIDSFGSIVKRKPFAIDYRHVEVKMPISDEAWFGGERVESAKFIPGPDCWKTLIGSPNQGGKAWQLLSKAIVGHVFDLMLYKDGVTSEQLSMIENTISCFKLAMPESFQLNSPSWATADYTWAQKNWMVATNLYLAAASFVITRLPIINQLPSPKEEAEIKELAVYNARLLELNEILKRWPPESLPYAHPCLACTIMTFDESVVKLLPPSHAIQSYMDLSGLILQRIAERWQLGAVLLRVRDLAYNYQHSDEETRAELMRQYPIYFDREFKRHPYPTSIGMGSGGGPMSAMWTPSTTATTAGGASSGSPSGTTAASTRPSADNSLSPEQLSQYQQQMPNMTNPNYIPPIGSLESMYSATTTNNNNNNNNNNATHPDTSMTGTAFQNFTSYPDPTSLSGSSMANNNIHSSQSPEDIDALFSGFLQEPWWQDFGTVNFVA